MTDSNNLTRLHLYLQGHVQGVGFRPFVYRIATELGLGGFVRNSTGGVIVEVEGPFELIDVFVQRLINNPPPHVQYYKIERKFIAPLKQHTFQILSSHTEEGAVRWILPDIATCEECLKEIFDPQNRRYLYPFTNCTHCGPRFTIIEALPYDRSNTTMRHFTMCKDCFEEYHDPGNRRFHAQPNACWNCGPRVALWDKKGSTLAVDNQAIEKAAYAVEDGAIVAIKGIGGFLLVVRCDESKVVYRLRERKGRKWKPFALMVPNLECAHAICKLSHIEERILTSSAAPIILALKSQSIIQNEWKVCEEVAPGLDRLGIMLPYSPLHHILLRILNRPVIATSGNLSDEPICIDEQEALKRLSNIADYFLVHNRPIVRHVDDSVVMVVDETPIVIRRARGYVPMPILISRQLPPAISFGGHLKNAIAIGNDTTVILSQHIGDLDSPLSRKTVIKVAKDLATLFETKPQMAICDLHPDYGSTILANSSGLPVYQVQHHVAHVLCCMAEHNLSPPAIGVAWDGTGYGVDHTVWGGEFFLITEKGINRIATFRSYLLPGGEVAILEPRRTALGILFEIYGANLFQHNEWTYWLKSTGWTHKQIELLVKLLQSGRFCPRSTSAGRLFDAIASFTQIRHVCSSEAQAAMELEACADSLEQGYYPWDLIKQTPHEIPIEKSLFPLVSVGAKWIINWQPMIETIAKDINNGYNSSIISARFHNTMAHIILEVVKTIMNDIKLTVPVLLSGGCFQNIRLLSLLKALFKTEAIPLYFQSKIPPGDGGLCLGQLLALAWQKDPYFIKNNIS